MGCWPAAAPDSPLQATPAVDKQLVGYPPLQYLLPGEMCRADLSDPARLHLFLSGP